MGDRPTRESICEGLFAAAKRSDNRLRNLARYDLVPIAVGVTARVAVDGLRGVPVDKRQVVKVDAIAHQPLSLVAKKGIAAYHRGAVDVIFSKRGTLL
jgi:hypothetical protein